MKSTLLHFSLIGLIAAAALSSCHNEDTPLSSVSDKVEKGKMNISWQSNKSMTYAYDAPVNSDALVLTLVSDGVSKTVLNTESVLWSAGGATWEVDDFVPDPDASATATLYSYLNGTGLTASGSIAGNDLTLTATAGNFTGLIASATTASVDPAGDEVEPVLTIKQAKLYLDPESNATAVTVSATVANTVNVFTGTASGSVALTDFNLLGNDLLVAPQSSSVTLNIAATINAKDYTGSKAVTLEAGYKYKLVLFPSDHSYLEITVTATPFTPGSDIEVDVEE
jgi:hypothetical protein